MRVVIVDNYLCHRNGFYTHGGGATAVGKYHAAGLKLQITSWRHPIGKIRKKALYVGQAVEGEQFVEE
jgi:hypothetical protein